MSTFVAEDTAALIRTAMAAQLRNGIENFNAQPYLLSNLTPPCATVLRGPVAYDQAMQHGVHHWTFLVRAYVASVTDIGAQQLLDQYLAPEGEKSIKAAIESDPTLGGVAADLQVTGATGEQELVREQGGPLLFSEWTVEVWL